VPITPKFPSTSSKVGTLRVIQFTVLLQSMRMRIYHTFQPICVALSRLIAVCSIHGSSAAELPGTG
jgi:hypothetical protein